LADKRVAYAELTFHPQVAKQGAVFHELLDPGCVGGALDLAGNVWEWTLGTDGSGRLRELRGGGFANGDSLVSCVPDDRFHQPPDARFDGYGFRCCTDARPTP